MTTRFTKKSNFKNRELSWLDFNQRILDEARDGSIPLFERLKFLAITESNLDEFFMVRVAKLKASTSVSKDISGMTAMEQLDAISEKTHKFVKKQHSTYKRSILQKLKGAKIRIVGMDDLNKEEEKHTKQFFNSMDMDLLKPTKDIEDAAGLAIHIAVMVKETKKKKNNTFIYIIDTSQVTAKNGLIIQYLKSGKFVFVEDVIKANLEKLFPKHKIISAGFFKILRDSNISFDDIDEGDFLVGMKRGIARRSKGNVVRMTYSSDMDEQIVIYLKNKFRLTNQDLYRVTGPIDLTRLNYLYHMSGYDKYKEVSYKPITNKDIDKDIFQTLKTRDILLHHPYESFDSVVNFINSAAEDEQVVAIKQTIYRVSNDSPIIDALIKAASAGKDVTVLVELRARFDEENNIKWAQRLEQVGCNVVYGMKNLKTHCKVTLVLRKEDDKIKPYLHLGTGNYNDATAKIYGDLGLLTSNSLYGEDALSLFNILVNGKDKSTKWKKFLVAPYNMKEKFIKMIRREARHVKNGGQGHVIVKCNSLCDRDIIVELYKASAAGVKIELIIRGICSLIPGIPKVSENITVRSIVGSFLEHARIFYFYNKGKNEYYIGSADWMPRNLEKRIEVVFPVENEELKSRLGFILHTQLIDTMKAQNLDSSGFYHHTDRRGKKLIESQKVFKDHEK